MIKYVCCFLLLVWRDLPAKSPHMITKNPFIRTELIPCDVIEASLRAELSVWHYRGYILTSTETLKFIPFIHLDNSQEWLAATSISPFKQSSWQIVTRLPTALIWQASLPNYCAKTLNMTMEFEKN